MVEGVGDFRAGEKGRTLKWKNFRIGVLICYEVIFPPLARAMVQNNASILINITNDAWYGKSSAPYQHFSMAIFRAVENRRSLVRAANTGISGFIDPSGRIIESTDLFKDAVITQKVPMLDMKTFYSRFGDVFAMACLGLSVFFILFGLFKIRIHT
jgi:apolipoprotein N-acyltransferase